MPDISLKSSFPFSQYFLDGYKKLHKNDNPTIDDLDEKVYWLWHILWDYLSDEERLEYINLNPEPFTSMFNDIDSLLEYCSNKYVRKSNA